MRWLNGGGESYQQSNRGRRSEAERGKQDRWEIEVTAWRKAVEPLEESWRWDTVTEKQGNKSAARKRKWAAEQATEWGGKAGRLGQLRTCSTSVLKPRLWAQRSAATGTTDRNISQVSKYSTQRALSLTTCLVPTDAEGKLLAGTALQGKRQEEKRDRRRRENIDGWQKGSKMKRRTSEEIIEQKKSESPLQSDEKSHQSYSNDVIPLFPHSSPPSPDWCRLSLFTHTETQTTDIYSHPRSRGHRKNDKDPPL